MRDRRIRFISQERADQIARRQGLPPAFDRATYKRRNVVERRFNQRKQFRDLATRYAKRAGPTIAAITLWLRWLTGHGLVRA
ncbi:hypothetical protein [Amycolatopsis thermophila]|uniref:Transposase n=1 Tax=Amycolatopsis thermophila TaxID=206084 RepID=A0ABU0ENW1_9PSEU|nr:hypothetical protein [Amycolatopsis thermophila]MDQ0376854.1 transposase [Amycolatopsis thermophila]